MLAVVDVPWTDNNDDNEESTRSDNYKFRNNYDQVFDSY
jgi:hypothetical protein